MMFFFSVFFPVSDAETLPQRERNTVLQKHKLLLLSAVPSQSSAVLDNFYRFTQMARDGAE